MAPSLPVDTLATPADVALPAVPVVVPLPVEAAPLLAATVEPIPGLTPAWSWTSLLAVAAALGVGYLLLEQSR